VQYWATAIVLAAACGCNMLGVGPVWSSDSNYAAYLVQSGEQEFSVRVFERETAVIHRPETSAVQIASGGSTFYCVDTKSQLLKLQPPTFKPELVPAAPDAVEAIAPRPGGQGVYCLTPEYNGKATLLYLQTSAIGNALSTAFEGEGISYPIVSPDGMCLYITRKAGQIREIAKFDISRDGLLVTEAVVFREATPEAGKEDETRPAPQAVPSRDGKKLLTIYSGENYAFLSDAQGKDARRIDVLGDIIWAGFGPTDDNIRFVVGDETVGRSVDVSVATGKTVAVGPGLQRFYGYVAVDPSGQYAAEMSPGGLRIADVKGLWERYYPESDDERLFAAEAVVAKHPEEALLYADDRQPKSVDGLKWYLIRAKAFAMLKDDAQSARAALEGLLLYPVTDLDIMAVSKKLSEIPVAVDPAALAVVASVDAQPKESVAALNEAEPMIARSDMLAGLSFRRGHAQFRLADFRSAAREFRKAAETDLFPQRDYAAVLSMVSYYLEGRVDLSNEISVFLKEKLPDSPLIADVDRLTKVLPVWADRPDSRKIRLASKTDLVADERSDYRLAMSLSAAERVQVQWLPRIQLALEQENEDGKKERRELVELRGFWAGYALRQDNNAFAVAVVDGTDIEAIVIKMPGVKLATKRFPNAYEKPGAGQEVLALEFSPSGARLTLKAPGVDLEMQLPETIPQPVK